MKEKRECKVIQDLLPNYIENLTSKETNNFIQEHLNECDDCKNVLESMKKNLEVNTVKSDGREVKYIKKYNNRLKVLRNILLIIVIVFIFIIGRKMIILTSLSNKANNTQNKMNYYTKTETYSEGEMSIVESFNKDGITHATMKIYSENGTKKLTFYKSAEEIIALIDNGTTKTIVDMGDIITNPVSFTGKSILENLFIAVTTSIDKINLNGKECYLIREGNTEKFVDIDTGWAIKMIDNSNNRTVDYKYEFGVVTDSDIQKPDTTGYKNAKSNDI